VLSGVVAALLTRDPHDGARAAAAAAWLHGMAGRLAAGGVAATASDVAEALPAAARIALESC
jgi:NAD(P)H-hydrate repair Nnr-like enzyme with NAD(P)H-hydrate dehydratase domain